MILTFILYRKLRLIFYTFCKKKKKLIDKIQHSKEKDFIRYISCYS